MRTELAAWHTSLWAALGFAAACGGRALDTDDTEGPKPGSGGTGAGGSSGSCGSIICGSGGGMICDFGGASGLPDSGTVGGAAGIGGSSIDVGGATGVGGAPDVGGAGGFFGTAGSSNAPSCTSARPRLGPDGKPTGYVECASGWVRRPEIRECVSIVPRPNPVLPQTDSGAVDGGTVDGGPPFDVKLCARDADCGNMVHGYCQAYPYGPGVNPLTICRSGCIRDEECGPGSACLCGDPVGTCVKASCLSDADCGGLACASSYADGCGTRYPTEFACQLPTDTCAGSGDCNRSYEQCTVAPSGRYCKNVGQCGRPFLVAGVPTLAPLVDRCSGWCGEIPAACALQPETRAALVRHWSDNGLMEHASVAAFARFVLQLLAFGAPRALVEDAQRALGDEIAHTKLCFALASRYAGRALGPGPLPVNGALEENTFFDAVATAITEACIGETLAAIEATEAAEHAADPEVRSALLTIAADESKHA